MFCPQDKNVIALQVLESLYINYLLYHTCLPELVVLHIWCKVVSLISQFTIFLGILPTFLLFLIYFVSTISLSLLVYSTWRTHLPMTYLKLFHKRIIYWDLECLKILLFYTIPKLSIKFFWLEIIFHHSILDIAPLSFCFQSHYWESQVILIWSFSYFYFFL